MERAQVVSEITEIVNEILDIEITDIENVKREDIEEWDSLEHINIILAIEENFGIKFQIDELKTVTEPIGIINKVMEMV